MNKKGFSILEVLIATSIISITVFGIYRLIGENTKSVEKANIKLTTINLFPVLENCIENNSSIGSGGYLDLGSDFQKCDFLSNEISNKIDGVYYTIFTEKELSTFSGVIPWKTQIFSDYLGTQTGSYIQKK